MLTCVSLCLSLSCRWLTGFVWRCRTTWTLWGTLRPTSSWRTSGQRRTSSKTPGTLKRWEIEGVAQKLIWRLGSQSSFLNLNFDAWIRSLPSPLFLPQLLPNLYHLGSAAREEVNSQSLGPIQQKLESMAGEVTSVMDQQLQVELVMNRSIIRRLGGGKSDLKEHKNWNVSDLRI